jgi:hypothetical protein
MNSAIGPIDQRKPALGHWFSDNTAARFYSRTNGDFGVSARF